MNKTVIEICGIVLTGIYLIVTSILNYVEKANSESRPSKMDIRGLSESSFAVLSNIIEGPVINLRVIDAKDNCGSESVALLYTWESVSTYCQCSDFVTKETCFTNALHNGQICQNYTQHTVPISIWKGKKICLNRLERKDWKLWQGGAIPCPAGFKLCKGGVCVAENILECPITDIAVSPTQPSSTEGTFKNISLFPGGNSIFISRDTEKTPLVAITAGIPSTPCINTKLSPKRSNGDSYPIIEAQPFGCDYSGNYGTDSSGHQPIDTDWEWNFYGADYNQYFVQLPGFREYVGTEKVTLFARKKIEFKTNKDLCLTYDYQTVKDFAPDLRAFEDLRLESNSLACLLCAIGTFFLIKRVIQLWRRKSFESNLLSNYALAPALITAFILIIKCGIGVSSASTIDSKSALLNELADSNCFKTEGYNALFKDLQMFTMTDFQSSKSYNTANLIISVLYLILGLILFILKLVRPPIRSDNSYELTSVYF